MKDFGANKSNLFPVLPSTIRDSRHLGAMLSVRHYPTSAGLDPLQPLFLGRATRQPLFHYEQVLCLCTLFSSIRTVEPSEPIPPKAIIPVPRMDHIHSPRRKALCSHHNVCRNHNCHGSPHIGARRFEPAECLADHHPQCDHRETRSPLGGLTLVPRNSPGYMQLLLRGPCSSHRLLVAHTRHSWGWTSKLIRPPPYVSDHFIRLTE